MLADVQTLVSFTEGDFRKRFPNIGFPETIETHHVAELGFAVVEKDLEPSLSAGETLEPGELRRDGDQVIRGWVVVPPSDEALASMFEHAVQSRLDASAKARGYDNISTAISYADEPAVPKFQKDGKAFRAWRSLVWGYAYEQLAAVKAGERERPTVDEFLAELPALELPA